MFGSYGRKNFLDHIIHIIVRTTGKFRRNSMSSQKGRYDIHRMRLIQVRHDTKLN